VSAVGMLQGLMIADHRPAFTAQVLEAKYCENCTKTFFRARRPFQPVEVRGGFIACMVKGHYIYGSFDPCVALRDIGPRFCLDCERRSRLPIDLDKYKAQLPTEAEQKHAYHLPHYDDSLMPQEARRIVQ